MSYLRDRLRHIVSLQGDRADAIAKGHRISTYLIKGGMLLLVWPMIMFIAWVTERTPPLKVAQIEPVTVMQGQPLKFNIHVDRDLSRECSVMYSRYTVDVLGQRSNESPVAYMNAKAIESLVQHMGRDRLSIVYPLTSELPPGPATYVTVMDWVCNPIHAIWPIQQVTEVPLTIIPKESAPDAPGAG